MSNSDSLNKVGSISGIIVFFIGVALLAFTFYSGLILLLYPERLAAFAELIPAPKINGQGAGELMSGLATIITRVVAYNIPILLILVLGYIASKIAAQGIQMYRTRPLAPSKAAEA